MCRLAIFPFIPAGKEKQAWELAQAITPYLVEKNRDGFGYMALGRNGLFGERWLDVDDAWSIPAIVHPKLKGFESVLVNKQGGYNSFGQHTKRTQSMALHSRMATCGRGLTNVHPFLSKKNDIGVVHNGMITNSASIGLGYSTCDSESIVTGYVKYDVADRLASLNKLVDDMEGWYASAILSKNKKGVWHMDIFRDARAPLHLAYVAEAGMAVLVTDPDHLDSALTDLKWAIATPIALKDNVAMRVNVLTGELTETLTIQPNVTKYESTTPYSTKWTGHGWAGSDSEYDPMYDERFSHVDDIPPSYKEYSPTAIAKLEAEVLADADKASDDAPQDDDELEADASSIRDLVDIMSDPYGVRVVKGG
jgi:Glutamine amidotransferase domain